MPSLLAESQALPFEMQVAAVAEETGTNASAPNSASHNASVRSQDAPARSQDAPARSQDASRTYNNFAEMTEEEVDAFIEERAAAQRRAAVQNKHSAGQNDVPAQLGAEQDDDLFGDECDSELPAPPKPPSGDENRALPAPAAIEPART
eukprot:6017681-Pleurochrysis_carterae.AAC.1